MSGAGIFATAVSTGGLGSGTALIADNISRAASNTSTVLYSGGAQAVEKASEFANKTGGTIIDKTKIGEITQKIATQANFEAAGQRLLLLSAIKPVEQ